MLLTVEALQKAGAKFNVVLNCGKTLVQLQLVRPHLLRPLLALGIDKSIIPEHCYHNKTLLDLVKSQ